MTKPKMESDQNKKKRNSDQDDFQEIIPSFEENQEGEDYLLEEETTEENQETVP